LLEMWEEGTCNRPGDTHPPLPPYLPQSPPVPAGRAWLRSVAVTVIVVVIVVIVVGINRAASQQPVGLAE